MRLILPENPCVDFSGAGTDFVYGITHVGGRKHNEDGLLIMKLPDGYLLAVADGLGGHNAGEVASRLALETLAEVFGEEYVEGLEEDLLAILLRKAHEIAHSVVRERAKGPLEGMGTTLVSAVVRGRTVIVANTGDSRAYLVSRGRLVARTLDHSPLQELVLMGQVSEEEAMYHPLRNRVSSAIGRRLMVDLYRWEVGANHILLLSTDGLHDYVPKEEILRALTPGKTARDLAKTLVERALPATEDNVTVVVWRW
ncbi:PP2C family protein-serine/threonine phosphatase [Thermococcus nautili]|uniref:Serine/threonine protein phosphatase n=1 Tax=Thermococcus nautili TaxID=195522 RepID=W8NSX9_9EURY|nr:protein phosphatase 2C domain-containing protein [Thermococcus nautili]AHL22348.1 Serine/threonine protein phosphatase [Thermococcus nautili]